MHFDEISSVLNGSIVSPSNRNIIIGDGASQGSKKTRFSMFQSLKGMVPA
jgi:hypothetical protein